MRGASVNFKKIHSAMHAVSHASRSVPPEYLLPPEHSLGTYVVIDDKGEVQKMLTEKMALASRQAKASKDYSPLWEGVINLPSPSKKITPEHQCELVKAWCMQYELITGHQVLRADVHLDEGFVDSNGVAQFNAHAHVMCDRTDDAGKVIKLSPKQLREIQSMTAEVTQLERGQDARKTKRQHLNHYQYRFVAEKNREQAQQVKEQNDHLFDERLVVLKEERQKVKDLKAELAAEKEKNKQLSTELALLKVDYDKLRGELKASKVATQSDYQEIKRLYLATKQALSEQKAEAAQASKEALEAKAETVLARQAADAATAQAKQLKSALEASQAQLNTVAADRDKAAQIANKNRDVALAYKAKLETTQAQLREAKEGERLFNDELKRTHADLHAKEEALERLKKAQQAALKPEVGHPLATPQKSLTERIQASFEAMLEWVKARGGQLRPLNKEMGIAIGPIQHMDEYHCVQAQGRNDYCIHRLDELDRKPRMDLKVEEITYRRGRGSVKPQPEQGMHFGR